MEVDEIVGGVPSPLPRSFYGFLLETVYSMVEEKCEIKKKKLRGFKPTTMDSLVNKNFKHK